MSTFECNYNIFLPKTTELPAWAKAERYEFCEPFFKGVLSEKPAKRKNAIARLLLSAIK